MATYRRLEDLVVYQKLCQLHIDVSRLSHRWPAEVLSTYEEYRDRYQECIRMLNGMERTLEKQLPETDRRWPQSSVRENGDDYDTSPRGFPDFTLNPAVLGSEGSGCQSSGGFRPEPRTPNPEF